MRLPTFAVQAVSLTASSSNPLLVPAPTIRYTSPADTGLLTFKPALNATGVVTITITVNDGGTRNNLTRRSFKVTVTAGPEGKNSAVVPTTVPANFNPAATLTTVASAPGQFSFQVADLDGGQYVVQAGSALVHWTSVQTNTAPFSFRDASASGFRQRFFRANYLP